MSAPCEDGVHLLCVTGPPELSRGSASERQQAYETLLRRFPATLNPRLLDRAEQISDVIAVPETMLRGFERQATGPGWALVGDAGLFKHPVTAQGIGDALAQGWYVGTALARGETLAGYAAWRADRAGNTSTGPIERPTSPPHARPPPTRAWSPTRPRAPTSSTPSPSASGRATCSRPSGWHAGRPPGPTSRA